MGYRFRSEERADEGLRRIVGEQIDEALIDLAGKGTPSAVAVHEARKRFKKVRAALRLVRGPLGATFHDENALFGDLGRRLSPARDAAAMLESFDALVETEPGGTNRFAGVRTGLEATRAGLAETTDAGGQTILEVLGLLRDARERVARWPLRRGGFAVIEEGLRASCRRGRRGLARAAAMPRGDEDTWHEWRKRVKVHWYHVRMLVPVEPSWLSQRRSGLRTLSEILGDDHDLAVLRARLEEHPAEHGGRDLVDALLLVLARRAAGLRREALAAGERLFEEKPRRLVRRLHRCWDAWQSGEGESN